LPPKGIPGRCNQVRGKGKDLKRRAQKFVALAQDNVQDVMETGQNAYAHAKKGVSVTDKSKRAPRKAGEKFGMQFAR